MGLLHAADALVGLGLEILCLLSTLRHAASYLLCKLLVVAFTSIVLIAG